MKTTEYTLENGLMVIHNYKEDYKIVDVRLLLGAGNFYNSYYKYTPGLAHFVEHVVHEKTEGFENKSKLTSIITDFGGTRNAATYDGETMEFFATILREFSENAFNYISEVVFKSIFDQAAVDKHRKIITEELLTRFKTPNFKAWNLFKQIAYKGTDFIYDTIGTEESVSKIGLEELKKFYDERFVTKNSILSISGDISLEECNILVNKYFATINRKGDDAFSNFVTNRDDLKIQEFKEKEQGHVSVPDKQAVVYFGSVLGGFNTLEFFSTYVLLKLLTDSSNSILLKKLREENNLLYHISGFMRPNQLTSLVYFNLNVQPENIQKCLDTIKIEIEKIANGEVADDELDKVKLRIKSYEFFYNQSIQDESLGNAKIKLTYKDIKDREDYMQKFIDVSRERVIESAKWLSENLNILAVCSNQDNKYNF